MTDENPHDVDAPGIGGDVLREVEADFDRMVDEMQTPAHRQAVDALFHMTGKQLGEAALRGMSDPG